MHCRWSPSDRPITPPKGARVDTLHQDAPPRQRLRAASLLDLDPDLGDGLDADRFALAREQLRVATAQVPAGWWTPPADGPGGLGLLIVDGVLLREVGVGERLSAELIGPGDVLRPGALAGLSWSPAVHWRVHVPLVLGILDRRAVARLARHPEVFCAVALRGVERAQRLATQAAICRFVRVEDRLHYLFWGLAERWGRVVPGGVRVDLRLTHEVLGLLVGARRPTVTTSLGRLVRAGVLEPQPAGGWLLRGEAPGGREP
jgi:CRP-like cAMP-binding protein